MVLEATVKRITIILFIAFLFLMSCATTSKNMLAPVGTLSYGPKQLITAYHRVGIAWAPFFLTISGGAPSIDNLRKDGIDAAKAKGIGEDNILFLNEDFHYGPNVGMVVLTISTFGIAGIFNFNEWDYRVTVVSRE